MKHPDPTNSPGLPGSRRGFVFGAIVVGALVLTAVLIALTTQGTGGSAPVAGAPTAAPPHPDADAGSDSVCGLPGFERAGTLTVVPDTDWVVVGTMAAPSRAVVGPGVVGEDGVRSCYAHTVAGAVFAAANLWAMGSDARLARLAVEQLTVPGPGRDAAIAADTGNGNTGVGVQIAGFKVLSYTGDAATIDIAFRMSTGQLVGFASALEWVGGDWKSVLTDEGKPPYRPVSLVGLGGYVPWAGVQ
jgi:hypothetical protein